MKESKVMTIQGNGTWEGKYGMMYKFDILLENGDSGEYSSSKYTSVEELPFKADEVIEYEFKDGTYPKILKPGKPGTSASYQSRSFSKVDDSVRQKLIIRQSSLQRATDYYIHHKSEFSPEDVITLADHYTSWVLDDVEKKTSNESSAKLKQAGDEMLNSIEKMKKEEIKRSVDLVNTTAENLLDKNVAKQPVNEQDATYTATADEDDLPF